MSLGTLTASMVHDLNQFIVAILTNGSACLRWLSREPPALEEGAAAVRRIMRDAGLAADVIGSIRAFLQKTAGRKTLLNIADVVHEVRFLVDAEGEKNLVAIEQSVAKELPPVLAVRVEVQHDAFYTTKPQGLGVGLAI